VSRPRTETLRSAGELPPLLVPRSGLVAEEEVAPGEFVQQDGPFQRYRRAVVVEHLADGRVRVAQTVELRLAIPFFSWLFAVPVRLALRPIGPGRIAPWWGPPARLNRRAAVVLASLCGLAVVAGYVGSLLPLTMTYAAREYGRGKAAQGIALGAVRASVIPALLILILADRRGRRKAVLSTAAGAATVTAVGALAPSLVWLTLDQMAALTFTAASIVIIGVMTAEEMPAGARAWSIAVVTLAVGLGSGLATMALPLAGTGTTGWRWLFVGALLALPVVARAGRDLPESRRFAGDRPAPAPPADPAPVPRANRVAGPDNGRLALLATGVFLYGLLVTPAGQFQNEYLRTERHFSAAGITVFSLVVGTLPALAILAGGRLADVRGRRIVAATGIGAGAVTTVAVYLSRGWFLWAWALVDSLVGYVAAPAINVYGPELFPTAVRSRSTGLIAIAFAAGGVTGLAATGLLSQAIGTIGPALAVMAAGPVALVVLIVARYPETAGRELEDLNPTDAASGSGDDPQ
jgi:MFS family permease